MALTPRQAEELKAIVDERRAALQQEVDRDLDRLREHGLGNVIGAVPDPGDESVQSQIQELNRADASRDLSELRMLDAARARMAEGSYGVCSNCGQDIGFERLRANPAAERCIRCQALYEKTHASALAPRL